MKVSLPERLSITASCSVSMSKISGVPIASFFCCFGEARLDVTHRVVAEVTRQSAGETRQAGQRCDLETSLVFLDVVQRIGDLLCGLTSSCSQRDLLAAHRDACFGRQADEGIAPETLAALHRFQQVGKRFVGELQIQRQRRVEIGEGLRGQRDAVVALFGKCVEFLFSDGGQHKKPPVFCRVGTVCPRGRFAITVGIVPTLQKHQHHRQLRRLFWFHFQTCLMSGQCGGQVGDHRIQIQPIHRFAVIITIRYAEHRTACGTRSHGIVE